MPFVNRFASPFAPPLGPFGALRNHPVILASGAATAGVVLGAYVAAQLLATPAKVETAKVDAAAAPPPLVASQPAPHIASQPAPPIAETNGSAPAAEPARSEAANVDCSKQTWPNISHNCMKGDPRVISTSRPDQSTATENAATQAVAPRQNVVTTNGLAARTESAAAPQPTIVVRSAWPANSPQPAEAAAAKASAPAVTEQPPPKEAVKAKTTKRFAKKTKRKPAKQEFDDDSFVATGDDGARESRRYDRSHRMVQRYERDDDDRDSEDGRRVTVIRRGGGGLFGGLFGNFGDSD